MAFGKNIDQRKANKRNHIIDLFRQHTCLSKATARDHSRYSMDTIISIFNGLLHDKVILPAAGEQKTKGRRAIFYTLNRDKYHYCGITFNQSGIYSVIISFSYEVREKHFTPLRFGIGREDFLEHFITHIKEIISRDRQYDKTMMAIGCSIPGDIDAQTGILHSYTFMPSLKEVNFRDLINKTYPKLKITIDHNIFSMASYFLREKDLIASHSRILFISARSGVGSGYIHNGLIVTGHGEFGHIRVSDKPVQCMCGRMGCLECFFSYHSFIELLGKQFFAEVVQSMQDEELPGLSSLARHYGDGNSEVGRELDRRLDLFSMALLDVINSTVPDVVLLTGDLFKVFGEPVVSVKKSIQKHYNDTGYVTHYKNTLIQYLDLSTEIASMGICFQMIKQDWDYQKE